MSQSRCKVCDKLIEWIELIEPGPNGIMDIKRIPVDLRSPTYEFNPEKRRWQKSIASVSHFSVCPGAAKEARKTQAPDRENWWEK